MVKTITLFEKAYGFLKRLKRDQKSFSRDHTSMKEIKQEIISFAGALKHTDLKSVEHVREESRKDWDQR